MKKLIGQLVIASVFLFAAFSAEGQKYITKTGHIRFFSSAPLEDIEANNYQVNAAIDAETGQLVFKVLMKAFQFEKALMQEHFNENYVYSDKFPNATFNGKVLNIGDIDFKKPGEYEAEIEGELTIKGETNEVAEKGTIKVIDDENIEGNTVFMVKLADYDIKIPGAVVDNISEEIEITVDIKLSRL
jgi:polyisoprenoid-binding protein YceI